MEIDIEVQKIETEILNSIIKNKHKIIIKYFFFIFY